MGFFDKIGKKESSDKSNNLEKSGDERLDLPPLPKGMDGSSNDNVPVEMGQENNTMNNNVGTSPTMFDNNEALIPQNPVEGLGQKQGSAPQGGMPPPDQEINENVSATDPSLDMDIGSGNNFNEPHNLDLSTPNIQDGGIIDSSGYDETPIETKVLGGEETITNPNYQQEIKTPISVSNIEMNQVEPTIMPSPVQGMSMQQERAVTNDKGLRPFTKDELIRNEQTKSVVNIDENITPADKIPDKQTFLKGEYKAMKKMGYNYIGFSSFRKIATLINGFPADLRIIDDVSKKQIVLDVDLTESYVKLEGNLEDLERDLIQLDKLIFE